MERNSLWRMKKLGPHSPTRYTVRFDPSSSLIFAPCHILLMLLKSCSHFSLGQENEMNLGLVVALKFWLAGNDTYFAKRQVGFAISFRVYGGEDICRWFFCQAVLITNSFLFC